MGMADSNKVCFPSLCIQNHLRDASLIIELLIRHCLNLILIVCTPEDQIWVPTILTCVVFPDWVDFFFCLENDKST